jgi:hypothetical protein
MYGTSVDTVGIEVFMKNGAYTMYTLCYMKSEHNLYLFFFTHIHIVTASSSWQILMYCNLLALS